MRKTTEKEAVSMKIKERILALLLSTAMLFSLMPPVSAMAESTAAPVEGQIQSFAALPDDAAAQTVPVGTEESALDLPDELTAAVYRVQEDTVQDSGDPESSSENESTAASSDVQPAGETEPLPGDVTDGASGESDSSPAQQPPVLAAVSEIVPVAWESEPAYDGEQPGEYLFTPKPGEGYTLPEDVEPPQITVTVLAPEAGNGLENPADTPNTATYSSGALDVGFAGHEWVVIGDKTGGVATGGDDVVTLLVKNDDFGTTAFSNGGNAYSGSTLQSKMEAIYSGFSDREKSLVLPRELDDIAGSAVTDAMVWPLSKDEAGKVDASIREFPSDWWLRSPSGEGFVKFVESRGDISKGGGKFSNNFGIRPAFSIKVSSAFFTSAASGASSKSSANVGGGLIPMTPPASGTVKYTMRDTSLQLAVLETDTITAHSGEEVNIAYTGATTGTGCGVSVLVCDTNGDPRFYGRAADCTSDSAAAGTASFILPGRSALPAGDYKLLVFSEQANGDNHTDFAGTPFEIGLTVEYSQSLIVEVNSNDANAVQPAVEAALAGGDKADFTTLQFTGSATEITHDNWMYLRNLYTADSEWDNLITLDLSGMGSLTKVDAAGYTIYKAAAKLTSVAFPASLQTIGGHAFFDCGGLKSVSFPANASLQSIGDYAFYNCGGLKSVSFPEGLQSIGNNTFSNCDGLTSVSFPEGLQSIGASAFYSCDNLTAFTVESGNQHFASVDGVLYNKAKITLLQYPIAKIDTTFTVLDGVSAIGDYAFDSCGSLTSVSFPEGLQTIGGRAFYECHGLTSVSFPEGLQTIGGHAFDSCDGLTSVSFPEGLQSIGASAFDSCTGLTSVSIPEGLQIIEDSAFYNCDGLTSVSFPESLQYIAGYAFRSCTRLSSLTFLGDTPPTVDAFPFEDVAPAGVIYYPEGASDYTDAWKQNKLLLDNWTLKPAYRLTVEHGRDTTNAGLYLEGVKVTITADSAPTGQHFDKWVSADSAGIADAGSSTTTFTMPAAHATVTATYKNDAPPAIPTYTLAVQAGAGGGVIGSPSDEYAQGAAISVKAAANPGYHFTGWTLSDPSLGSSTANPLTFKMPDKPVTLTANFEADTGGGHTHSFDSTWSYDKNAHWHECTAGDKARADEAAHTASAWITDKAATETEAGSRHRECTVCRYVMQTETIAPTGPAYSYRTPTDPVSGIQVSGYFTADAVLEVKDRLLHQAGDCDVCDGIRVRQDRGELIVLFDIGLKSGSYTGDLNVEIPVDAKYNGQTVLMLHCKEKVLESRTVTVSGGVAKGTFSSLSPFAAAVQPSGATAITGLPESYALLVSNTVSWTPAPAGGVWSYDADLLFMTKDGDTYTFKALKTGKATATYTVDGVPFTVTITINDSTIPQTGDTINPLPWLLVMLVALTGGAALLLYRKRRYTKRHG